MTRTYSDLADENVQILLNTLADRNSEPDIYKETMSKIGMSLDDAILAQIDDEQCDVYLACTVEDADFLFQFFYFAKDDERTPEGEVIPGIGGNVYYRLGFEGQDSKNKYIPEVVKARCSKFTK